MAAKHSLYLAVAVGNTANFLTTWLLLGYDFFMNIYTCLKIIWTRRKRDDISFVKEKLGGFVMGSTIAIVIPIGMFL